MSSRSKKIDNSSATINFTKAIQNVTKTQESFYKGVDTLKDLIKDSFEDLELKLQLKHKELKELEDKFTHEERNKKLEVDLNIKEYGYTEALNIIKERGEISVSSDSYAELKQMYEDIKKSRDDDVKSSVKQEQDRNSKHIAIITQTLELKNKAEVAKVQAQLESQVKQIQVLEKTIDRFSKDLDEQRKLTRDVANASHKQPVYLPSHNSK